MSFTRMHNDWLDPDRAGLNDENWGEERDGIVAAVRALDSGRWPQRHITCSWTGKDADLQPWGHQGVEVLCAGGDHGISEDGVQIRAHGYKTFAGLDVTLNLEEPDPNEPDEFYEARCDVAREDYLDMAAECLPEGFEWDGDAWVGSFRSDVVTVPWAEKADGTLDYERTALDIQSTARKLLAKWEVSCTAASGLLMVLSGWREADGSRCELGKPGPGAAWRLGE